MKDRKNGRRENGKRRGREGEGNCLNGISIAFLVQSVDHSLSTRLIKLRRLHGFHGLKSLDGRDREVAPTEGGVVWRRVAAYGVWLLRIRIFYTAHFR